MEKLEKRFGESGVHYAPAPALLPGDGDRAAWTIRKNGQTIGNAFLLREGKIVHTAEVTGFVCHDAATVEKLLGPLFGELRRRAK